MTNVNAFISFINDVRMWDKFLNINISLYYKYIYNINLHYKYILSIYIYDIYRISKNQSKFK